MCKMNFFKELKDFNIPFHKNWDAGKHSNFKIGGKITAMIEIYKISQMMDAMRILNTYKKRYFVIGNLTNVLISDGYLDVIFIRLKGDFEKILWNRKNLIFVGAGVSNEKLLKFMVKNNLGGLEFLAGIPGTIGGAVYMNAGAYGKLIGDYIIDILILDRKGRFKVVQNKNIFSYRNSIFQKDRSVILGAEIKVFSKDKKKVLKEIKEIISIRRAKHPWKAACAGSFFKNTDKFPAGMLIEDAGLKGFSVGGAMVSKMHGNFIINKGDATFKDVIKLANIIKNKVYKKYKIKLKEEVVIIK
ncbi:MAG: UDP-N-acetylmuramate dehydrogenase [Candidatus Goldbacteria bacterium]|nr:UDP-N-acetylmuramate dehydrogenase [Candidatus Goldiibacteriota bacterium]